MVLSHTQISVLYFFTRSLDTSTQPLMNEWETVKRPRLDSNADQDTIPAMKQQLPFSTFLSNSFRHNEKHPILSDKKLVVYDLKGTIIHSVRKTKVN